MSYTPPVIVNNDPNIGRKPDFYERQRGGPAIIYADFDFNLTTHPVTKDIVMKTNAKAIKQSLENLVLTTAGEIVMEPEIGGGVNTLLFGQNDAITAYAIRSKMMETIKNHESRIELEDVEVFRSQDGLGMIIIVSYYLSNQPDLQKAQILLDKLR